MTLYCTKRRGPCTRAETWAGWKEDQERLCIPPIFHLVRLGNAWVVGRFLPFLSRNLAAEAAYVERCRDAPGDTAEAKRYWARIGSGDLPYWTRLEDYHGIEARENMEAKRNDTVSTQA